MAAAAAWTEPGPSASQDVGYIKEAKATNHPGRLDHPKGMAANFPGTHEELILREKPHKTSEPSTQALAALCV